MDILVIDEHPAIRAVLSRMLSAHGFVVHTEPSIHEAALSPNAARFDLVILDGAGGNYREHGRNSREARAIWDAPVLLLSAGTHVREQFVQFEHYALLAKPFTRESLLQAVAASMASSPLEGDRK